MAGIFGCFKFRGNADLHQIADLMVKNAYSVKNTESRSGSFTGENIYLGFEKPKNADERIALLQSQDQNFSLLLFGELFLPSGELLASKNFESEFLRGYERTDINFLLHCDGAFVLALHDEVKKTLLLATDPFGNLALHYSVQDGIVLFGTRQSAIAAAIGDNRITDQAITELIALGQRLNGNTLYHNIYRLSVASFLSVTSEGTPEFGKYYKPDYHSDILKGKKEHLRDIEDTLLRSVDIRLHRDGVICGLTGGLDSRITIAAIKRLGKTNSITTFTHGLPKSGDMRIAERISSLYKIPHLQIPFDDKFFSELPQYWRDVVMLSEGSLGLENAFTLISWQRQSEQFSVLVDSHGGPLYRRQILKSKEGKLRRSDDFINTFFGYFSSSLLKSGFLKPDLLEAAKSTGLDAVKNYFSELPSDLSVGDRIDRFYLEQMCANKYSLAGNAQLGFIGLSHPLMSLKTFDSVTKISSDERKKNSIYRYLLNRFAPELKNILVDNSGYTVPYYGYRSLRYMPQAFERLLSFLPLKNHISLRRPIASYELLLQKNIDALKELLLNTDNPATKYFIRENIENVLVEFEKTGRHAAPLLQAANIYLLLEVFDAKP